MSRVALAVIHGIGSQDPGYADRFMGLVRGKFARVVRSAAVDPGDALAARVLVLSDILRTAQREILSRVRRSHRLDWRLLRAFMADYVGDAIGYQRTERPDIYRQTHIRVAEELNALDQAAGPGSALAIAAHSLGSIVVSNYIWDLQEGIVPAEVEPFLTTPASRLETLAHLYTMGSPLALWTLRFPGFGAPIRFPVQKDPILKTCEWVNFFDDDDVVSYPLRGLSEAYGRAVSRDALVHVGGWLTRWNPFCHGGYWGSRKVAGHIARRLGADWKALNPKN